MSRTELNWTKQREKASNHEQIARASEWSCSHSEHRFPAPSAKEGCRKPVLGVWELLCAGARDVRKPVSGGHQTSTVTKRRAKGSALHYPGNRRCTINRVSHITIVSVSMATLHNYTRDTRDGAHNYGLIFPQPHALCWPEVRWRGKGWERGGLELRLLKQTGEALPSQLGGHWWRGK